MSWWNVVDDFLRQKQVLIEIVPGLFLGGSIRRPDLIQEAGIQVMIDLSGRWDNPVLADFLEEYHWFGGIVDGPEMPNLDIIHWAASIGVTRLRNGKKVMVHCFGGHNRAPLILGLILLKMGIMTGREVVLWIQSKVPDSLTNDTFRKYLEDQA